MAPFGHPHNVVSLHSRYFLFRVQVIFKYNHQSKHLLTPCSPMTMSEYEVGHPTLTVQHFDSSSNVLGMRLKNKQKTNQELILYLFPSLSEVTLFSPWET